MSRSGHQCHILPLLDSGAADWLLYYVMPVVMGDALRARLTRERQLPVPKTLCIAPTPQRTPGCARDQRWPIKPR